MSSPEHHSQMAATVNSALGIAQMRGVLGTRETKKGNIKRQRTRGLLGKVLAEECSGCWNETRTFAAFLHSLLPTQFSGPSVN